MASRLNLQTQLETILGNHNVYFQPPESVKLNYPCIIYSLNRIDAIHADDCVYKTDKSYTLIFVCKEPDNDIVDILANLPRCRFDRPYVTDNLYHYSYTIYY